MTAGVVATGTILDRILTQTALDLDARRAMTPLADVERKAAARPAPVSLRAALSRAQPAVIAEIKRASPSRGVFPVPVDPGAVAGEYLDGGAAALSILTDGPFFHGSLVNLAAGAVVAHDRPRPVPVLRKDFVLDPYQIAEAKAHGADAVLLIVAALSDERLMGLLAVAGEYGLDALVEVHDETEMARAASVGATLIGINNRDLRTFGVDLATTERVAPKAPPGATLVGESGIFTAEDVARLARAGVGAVLVGESLILAGDRAAAVRSLRGVAG